MEAVKTEKEAAKLRRKEARRATKVRLVVSHGPSILIYTLFMMYQASATTSNVTLAMNTATKAFAIKKPAAQVGSLLPRRRGPFADANS